MAKRGRPQTFARVRIETFERVIGHYLAQRQYDKADAVRFLASQCNIVLNEERIDEACMEMATFLIDRYQG